MVGHGARRRQTAPPAPRTSRARRTLAFERWPGTSPEVMQVTELDAQRTVTGDRAPAPAPGRTVGVGAHRYPLVLPSVRDARLHLAVVITTLQVLGQTAFHFDLSITQ